MGSLVLVDGSQFDWLGTGRPVFLLGAIDDATSNVWRSTSAPPKTCMAISPCSAESPQAMACP